MSEQLKTKLDKVMEVVEAAERFVQATYPDLNHITEAVELAKALQQFKEESGNGKV